MSPVFTGVFGYEQATEQLGNICLAICVQYLPALEIVVK